MVWNLQSEGEENAIISQQGWLSACVWHIKVEGKVLGNGRYFYWTELHVYRGKRKQLSGAQALKECPCGLLPHSPPAKQARWQAQEEGVAQPGSFSLWGKRPAKQHLQLLLLRPFPVCHFPPSKQGDRYGNEVCCLERQIPLMGKPHSQIVLLQQAMMTLLSWSLPLQHAGHND